MRMPLERAQARRDGSPRRSAYMNVNVLHGGIACYDDIATKGQVRSVVPRPYKTPGSGSVREEQM